MKRHRHPAPAALVPAALALALALGAAPAAAQIRTDYRGSLSIEEFVEIHGTTDRYELLAQEIKGDCTQCHKQRAETEATVGAGYLYRRKDGGAQTLRPYEKLDSHPEGYFDLYHRDPGWGRLHATGEYLGGTDHAAQVDVRYKNLVVGSATSQGFPHNEENVALPPSTGEAPPLFFADDRNPGGDYRKEVSEQTVNLRVGPGVYPAHVRVMARRFAVEGDSQLTFLDENCTTNCHNISRKRDLDHTTAEIEGGADAHAGYGMASYSYNFTQFRNDEADPEHVFGPITGVTPGGVSAHNTYPDARAWEHRVRVSTTQTGQVTASAGLHMGRVTNEDVDVARNYYRGDADLGWAPWSWLSAALKFRRTHKADDVGSADAQALRADAGLPMEYELEENRYAAQVSVRPLSRLTLRGDAVRTEQVRTQGDGFGLPTDSRKTEWKTSAQYRPVRGVTLRGSYGILLTDDEQGLPTAPTEARTWQAWASVQPWWFLNFNGSWLDVRAENEDYDRDEERTVAQASLTVTPVAAFSVGGFVARFRNEVKAPVDASAGGVTLRVDHSAPYEAVGTQYGVFADWEPVERLTLRAQFAILRAEGSFETSSADFGDLGAFSEFDARQWDLGLDLGYEWQSGWGLASRFARSAYRQDGAFPEDDEDVIEGRLILSKRW